MLRSRQIAISFALCGVILGGIALHHVYERHLSGDFKRLMVAADDEHESMAEQSTFIHEARLSVRTDKDLEVLRDFEEANDLRLKALETSERVYRDIQEQNTGLDRMAQIFAEKRGSATVDQVQLAKDIESYKASEKRKVVELRAEANESKDQMKQAIIVDNKVRRSLGLPEAPLDNDVRRLLDVPDAPTTVK